MRILVHGSQLLYPTNTGGRIRTSKLFEQLSRHHDITWVCLRRPEETDQQVQAMKACCARIETFPFVETPKFTPAFYRDLARNLVSQHPFVVEKYFQPALRARLAELIQPRKGVEAFDLLLCDFLQPSLNVMGLPFGPRVLFQHNVESVIFERHFKEKHLRESPLKNGPAKAYLYLQWRKLLAYEGRAARWFDHNIMVSEQDCATMQRLYGVTNTSAIPTGVDADYFHPQPGAESPAHELVFTGSMDWLPNIDGITWFANEILPLVQRELPVKLWVVGRKPMPAVTELAAKHPGVIEVTGTVDDVRPYMARSRVYLVPLRIGGGTRMKIYEAMAMALPVVSTRVGAEGLPVTDGRDILLADDPAAFARRTVELLRDEGRRRSLGAAGRRLVTESFSWESVARSFGDICQSVVDAGKRGAARGAA
jgi:glycosyltransferase involved in cell wall biosynthesis